MKSNDSDRARVPIGDKGIRLIVDGQWTALEMADFLRVCDDLYNYCCLYIDLPSTDREVAEKLSHDSLFLWVTVMEPERLFRISSGYHPQPPSESYYSLFDKVAVMLKLVQPDEAKRPSPLKVNQIQYPPQGFTDLFGSGRAIFEVRSIIQGIIRYVTDEKKRTAEVKNLELKNESLTLKSQKKRLLDEQQNLKFKSQRLKLAIQYASLAGKHRDNPFTGVQPLLSIEEHLLVLEKLVEKGSLLGVEMEDFEPEKTERQEKGRKTVKKKSSKTPPRPKKKG